MLYIALTAVTGLNIKIQSYFLAKEHIRLHMNLMIKLENKEERRTISFPLIKCRLKQKLNII